MNKKNQILQTESNWKKYHSPGCANYCKRKKNTIFTTPSNGFLHEAAKLKHAMLLQKEKKEYITEAVRNTRGTDGKDRRVDLVCLSDSWEYEYETIPKRAERFKGENGVIVIELFSKELKDTAKRFEELLEEALS